MFEHWRPLHDLAFQPDYVPDISDRDGRAAMLFGVDAVEAYANTGNVDGIFDEEAVDAINAAEEFFQAAADSILIDEGLT